MRFATGMAAALIATASLAPATSAQRDATPGAGAGIRLTGEIIQGGLVTGQLPAGATLSLDGKPVAVAADGRFLVGFDRDAAPVALLAVMLADGHRIERSLAVAARAWDISRLPTLPKTPLPDADFARIRPPELAQIEAARATPTDAGGWRQRFRWPLTGRISTLFGSQRIYANGEAGSYHSGIDIAQPTGTVVLAPADGVVVLAADHPFTLEGNLLLVDHGMGLSSAFMHLSRIDVGVGDHVRRGEPIGLVGMTGRATGPHLHWGLRWRTARLDPLLLAGPMGAAPGQPTPR